VHAHGAKHPADCAILRFPVSTDDMAKAIMTISLFQVLKKTAVHRFNESYQPAVEKAHARRNKRKPKK